MDMQVSPMRRLCALVCKIEDSNARMKGINEERFFSILDNLSKWNALHCQATEGKAGTYGWSAVLAPITMVAAPFLPKGLSEGVSQLAKDGFVTNMLTTNEQKNETQYSALTQLSEKDWRRAEEKKQVDTELLRKVNEAYNSAGNVYSRG